MNTAESQSENTSEGKAAAKSPRRPFQPRERGSRLLDRRAAPPEALRSEFEFRKWEREREAEIEKIERAYKEHPPGGKLFVQTRTIPARRRAGLVFSNKGSVEVEIVDASDEDVVKAVVNGQSVVTPMGAKAIVEDEALIVSDAPSSKETVARVAELENENEQLKAELASLRSKRVDPDKVSPERLKGKPAATSPASPPPATTSPATSEADQILADAKNKQQNPTK